MKVLKMVQMSKYRWNLISPKGPIIKDDLLFANAHKAEEWVKSYVSSFQTWEYIVIPKELK